MKVQLIAFSNHTMKFLRDNVLLSLRPAQNEVHPSHGRAHSGGHTGAWAWAEESYHPHLLWYDAVWAELQPQTHVWKGKSYLRSSALRFFFWCFWLMLLPAKYDICDVYDCVCFNSHLIFAVWERTDNKIGSRGRRRPRGWAVQSPAGENVRQGSRSNRKNLILFWKLFK